MQRVKKNKGMVGICLLMLCLLLVGCGETRGEKIARCKQTGIDAMSQGDYAGAVEQFNEAMQLYGGRVSDDVVDICFYKAAALFEQGEVKQALEVYTALIKYDDTNAAAFFLRGSVYLQEGERDKALADYTAALERSDEDYTMYLRIAENLKAQGQDSDARQILEQGLDKKDNSANGYLGRGRIYLALEEEDKAVAELEKAVDKKARDARIYLAQAYERLGEAKKASEILAAYAKEENPSGEALAVLGRMEMENGNYEQALAFYQQGLEKDTVTNEQELRKGEIIALEYAGRFAEAEQKMQEYLTLYPKDKDALREEVFLKTR